MTVTTNPTGSAAELVHLVLTQVLDPANVLVLPLAGGPAGLSAVSFFFRGIDFPQRFPNDRVRPLKNTAFLRPWEQNFPQY